ncbi:MAG: HlyD family efflux transporter periplasmic adaptor subunit [Bacteroidetes bacterium]|nr:HlyD family efflux transporter periplasmic adaptor subunit [Bacteroidota bacterium]
MKFNYSPVISTINLIAATNMKNKIILTLAALAMLASCKNGNETPDASGTFEATEILLSAETPGKLIWLNAEEGDEKNGGDLLAILDTTQLHLKRVQLQNSLQALEARMPESAKQLAVINEQIKSAEREETRMQNLIKQDAGNTKTLDDIKAQLATLKRQYTATESTLNGSSRALQAEMKALQAQLLQTKDLISKSYIHCPIKATILSKYIEANEFTGAGKPLFKIADLSQMELRVYVTGDQLPKLKLGQELQIRTDSANGAYSYHTGTLSWIATQAEFTPKTIQTKDERANLVYAAIVKVKNNGFLKIGMYGELNFKEEK